MVALVVACAAARAAAAPADDTAKLRAEVEDLRRALADLPSAMERLHALENRVEALRAEAARVAGARAVEPELALALDALAAELGETRRRLAALEARTEQRLDERPLAYDHGVVLRLGGARLTVNGLLQARWVAAWARDLTGIDTVDLHHGELGFTGEVGDWLTARISLDFGAAWFPLAPFAVRGGLLRDAYLEVRPLPWLSLRAGQFAVPFGRERLLHDRVIAAAERNLATLAFTLDRDLGALVEARLFGDRVVATASVTDGIDAGERGARNDNLDFRYVGRLAISPLGAPPPSEGEPEGSGRLRFTAAGGVLYDLVPTNDPGNPDRDGNGRVDNVAVWSAQAELAVAWDRLSGQAEYFWRREDYGGLAPLPTRSFQGFSLQAQALVVRGYGLVEAHLAYAEPHTLATRLAVEAAPPSPFNPPVPNASPLDTIVPQSAWQLGGSLVAFLRVHELKLQATFDWSRRTVVTGPFDAWLVQVQATAGF